ncbi:MAG: hypothetical protein J0H83_07010 [Candidatus Melainabacteria bacterium]|jgi:hypothetical protein|nr:hypothetical protein [Candidatus Melainabacteria bacterium]
MQDKSKDSDSFHRTGAGKISLPMALIALGFVGLACLVPRFAASQGMYGQPPVTPPPIIIMPPPPVTRPPIVVPTDVTSPQLVNPEPLLNIGTAFALNGVQTISPKEFPNKSQLGGDSDWITVLSRQGAQFSRPNPFQVDLKQGDIIVSVKNPSKLAMIATPYGDIAVGSNGDCMVTMQNGVLRIFNFDGEGKAIKANLNKGPFAPKEADPIVAIAAGYELIAADAKLTRRELRPHDGIARRHAKVLESGNLAISEFSIESAIKSCDMLIELQQKDNNIKERRMLSDMAKMASILNYKVGAQGFTTEK